MGEGIETRLAQFDRYAGRRNNQKSNVMSITYIDTFENNNWSYEDYKEWCEANGIEVQSEESQSYYEWLADCVNRDWEDFFENLKYSKVNGPCSVVGTLGLWFGTRSIESKKFDSLEEAIRACVDKCDEAKIELKNGILSVTGYHHDGTNNFTIHRAKGHFFPKYLF